MIEDFKNIQNILANWTSRQEGRQYQGCPPCINFALVGVINTIHTDRPYSKWDCYRLLKQRAGKRGVLSCYSKRMSRHWEIDAYTSHIRVKDRFDPVLNTCFRLKNYVFERRTLYNHITQIYYVYNDSIIVLSLAKDGRIQLFRAYHDGRYEIMCLYEGNILSRINSTTKRRAGQGSKIT